MDDGEVNKPVVVILVGVPGSGKSTFCEHVINSSSTRPWVRICQDTIGNGKAGTKAQCVQSAATALKDGKSVFIDRCNLDKEQRSEFVKLGCSQVDMHAVVLDLPARLCISRSVKRNGHEGNLQGGRAAAVVNKMLREKELPKLGEGFLRITFCHRESDVQVAIDAYSGLSPQHTLPSGCYGQQTPDAKIQLGIRKFLKIAETPVEPVATNSRESCQNIKKVHRPYSEASENVCLAIGKPDKLDDAPTLAFPSISTADFQFELEKASDIIVETVEEFTSKFENARLVLVDLSHGSRILSLVRAKAAQKNIDTKKFFTFVGDITQLYTKGGLRSNVIANAANWRLKPGGGGVNAAIYRAAGPILEVATKKRAGSLLPGKSIIVPLPSSSPLFNKEGVSHVIHVLGPNMNPNRPNCLNDDYINGCTILREAYSSLFNDFMSILKMDMNFLKKSGDSLVSEVSKKKADEYEFERNRKSKGAQDDTDGDGKEISNGDFVDKSIARSWSSWAQDLHQIAMHPERHKNAALEISDDLVVSLDRYPKAQKHVLVLSRIKGLDSLADVHEEHLHILRRMHDAGLKWAEKFISEDASLIFRLGYHSVPSMRQLHLHVVSQDFDSKHLKNKKHWNSFNTGFFVDSIHVINTICNHERPILKDNDKFLSSELRCHRCKSVHPNLPRLKSHIGHCCAPFPSALQNGCLVSHI